MRCKRQDSDVQNIRSPVPMIIESHDLDHEQPELHHGYQGVIGMLSNPLLDILMPHVRLTLIATQ